MNFKVKKNGNALFYFKHETVLVLFLNGDQVYKLDKKFHDFLKNHKALTQDNTWLDHTELDISNEETHSLISSLVDADIIETEGDFECVQNFLKLTDSPAELQSMIEDEVVLYAQSYDAGMGGGGGVYGGGGYGTGGTNTGGGGAGAGSYVTGYSGPGSYIPPFQGENSD